MESTLFMVGTLVLVLVGGGALSLRHIAQTRRIDELGRSDRG